MVESIHHELKTVKTYVLMTDQQGEISTTLPNVIEYEALLRQQSEDFDFPEISESSRQHFVIRREPRKSQGVIFTHRDLVLHALSVCLTWGLYPWGLEVQANQVYMPLTPMFHVQAWGVPYFAFMLGCKFILPENMSRIKY